MNKELVQQQIERLKAVKPKVPQNTFFGDDNWQAIDAQVKTLERALHIDGTPTGDWINREFLDGSPGELTVQEAAMEAASWVEDIESGSLAENDDSPAAGWEELAG